MSTAQNEPRFEIGTDFYNAKRQRCTVVDILRTYNWKDELVAVRYVAAHQFCGQTVIDRDVLDITIAKGKI